MSENCVCIHENLIIHCTQKVEGLKLRAFIQMLIPSYELSRVFMHQKYTFRKKNFGFPYVNSLLLSFDATKI
jgi:hypothetical protein